LYDTAVTTVKFVQLITSCRATSESIEEPSALLQVRGTLCLLELRDDLGTKSSIPNLVSCSYVSSLHARSNESHARSSLARTIQSGDRCRRRHADVVSRDDLGNRPRRAAVCRCGDRQSISLVLCQTMCRVRHSRQGEMTDCDCCTITRL